MFHTPHLTFPSEGEGETASSRVAVSGLRSVATGPRSPATAAAKGTVGMSGIVMLGEVGDIAQIVGEEKVSGDDEKVDPFWRSVEALEGAWQYSYEGCRWW